MKLKKKSKKNKQMLDVVEEELEKEEIVMPDNDNIDRSYIKLPLHLDEQHSRDVGRYLHALTQQRNWTRTLLARSQVYVREYKETLQKMKEDIFSECPAKMSVTEKELRLYKNPNCKSLIDQINHFESRLIMLNSYMDSLEESIFVVSREITRRGGDSAIEGRGENVRRIKK